MRREKGQWKKPVGGLFRNSGPCACCHAHALQEMMIIACPACATRYAVPDNAIGAQGRTVRCAKCRHSWFQDGTPYAEAPVPAAAPVAPVAPPPAPPPPPRPRRPWWNKPRLIPRPPCRPVGMTYRPGRHLHPLPLSRKPPRPTPPASSTRSRRTVSTRHLPLSRMNLPSARAGTPRGCGPCWR
jgi:predicted Zn finger-like uncharacterized protein